jgi:5-methylcytosine-specific restriction protein A
MQARPRWGCLRLRLSSVLRLQGLPTLSRRLFHSVLMPLLQTLRPRLSAQPVERTARVLQPPGTARMTSRPWARLRAKVLMSNPLCVKCAATGRVQAAHEVDHIVPLHSGGTHDRSNLQALCSPCHAEKTASEAGSRARGDAWGGIKRIEG